MPGMEPDKLYLMAKSVAGSRRLGEYTEVGNVGAAIQTDKGNIYTGVNIDTACSMGFCAEHAAAAAMVTAGETHIKRVIAVSEEGRIMAPCGRCREFMLQLDPGNENTIVTLEGGERALRELLPHDWRK